MLTNGQVWQEHHVYGKTGQQVETHLALEIGLLGEEPIAHKIEGLFPLHRAALKRGLIDDLWTRKAATSAASLAEVLVTPPVLEAVRKEIRRASGHNPEPADLQGIIRNEVVRADITIKS